MSLTYKYLAAFCLYSITHYSFAQSNSHYEKALQSYVAKDYNESYIHLKNALKDNPSDLAAKLLMGEMLLINGYFNEAVTEFEESLGFGADPNLALKSYGKALILTKKFSDILRLEFDNLSADNDFELNLLRATAYASLGERNNAEKSYLLAYALQPKNIRVLNSLATLYIKQGDINLTQKYLDLSLEYNNNNASTWRLKGLLEKQKKQTEQALISFEKAYELNPDDPFILRAYADGLWESKRVSEAEDILKKILAQTPDDPYAMLLQSQILSASNKTAEAEKLLNKLALDLTLLDAQNVASNISLRFASGMTAYLTNNYEQALSDIIYYVNNSQIEVNTLGVLADTYVKLNKERSALKLLENNETLVTENLNLSLILCDLYIKNNRAFKCETLSAVLKEKYPNQPKVDFVKAKTLVARNKAEQAIALLSNIEDDEYEHQKQLAIAHLYFQTEKYESAYKIAKNLLNELPNNIDILNLNVALLIKRQEWSKAQKLIDKTLDIQADYIPALYNQANLHGAIKEYDKALAIMTKLEKKGPLPAESYLLYADLLSSTLDYKGAIEKLRFASKLDDRSIPISEKLIELYISTEAYKEALWEIDTYSKKTLSNEKYILTKAELLHKVGRVDDASKLLTEQSDKWQNDPTKLLQLSRAHIKVKNLAESEKVLITALSLTNNKFLPALLELSQLYLDTNRADKAKKHLDIALKLYPKQPAVLVAQASVHKRNLHYQTATDLLWSAINLSPGYFPAYRQLYQLSNMGKGTEKFVDHVETILNKSPDSHLLRNLLADTYLQNGQKTKATAHYLLLSDIPDYSNAAAVLNNLAYISIEKDLSKALSLVEKGLALAPKSANLIDTKGWIMARQGQYSQALVLLRQAYSMNSNDPTVRYHIAYTLYNLNRKDEAKQTLEQALALNQPFADFEAAKRLLDSL